MKNLTLIVIAAFAFFLTACGSQNSTITTTPSNANATVETVQSTEPSENKPSYRTMTDRQTVPVSEEDFNALVKFIEAKGFSTGDGDTQYTFFDSKKNRHALMVIRRDENSKPSKEGKAHISVWSYYKGIKNQEHFFGWDIKDGKAGLHMADQEYEDKHFESVKFGYEEFLAKVKKSS